MIPFQTPRLTLRWMNLRDASFIRDLLNSPGWIRFVGNRNIDTLEKAEDFLNTIIIPSYEKFGFGFYLLQRKQDNESLGICGLVKREGLDDVDLGYALLPQYEGQGYALEAAQATLEYGFSAHGLERIVAISTPDNKASLSLLNKLGMVYQKKVRLADDDIDLVLYSTVRKK